MSWRLKGDSGILVVIKSISNNLGIKGNIMDLGLSKRLFPSIVSRVL